MTTRSIARTVMIAGDGTQAPGPAAAHDPAAYWNARARRFADDPTRAVGLDDADQNRAIDRVQRHVLSKAQRAVAPARRDRRALDFGCGAGRWVQFLRARGYRYAGVDVAGDMLALARRLHPDAELAPFDGQRTPYPDGAFDLVWTVAVVHHNPYDAHQRLIEEMARVLRDGGHLVLFEGLGTPAEADAVYFPRPLAEWIALAERCGLHCRWQRGARYAILRAALARFLPRAVDGFWSRWLTRLDARIDPYLLPLLPRAYHARMAMVFEKRSAT